MKNFRKHEGTPLGDYYALEAILEYAKSGDPIPKELLTYLVRAKRALIRENKQGKFATNMKNSAIVWDVQLNYRLGEKIEDAMHLAAQNNNAAYTSVKKYYYSGEYEDAKADADMIFTSSSHWGENTEQDEL